MKASLLLAVVFTLPAMASQAASNETPAKPPSEISAFSGPHNGFLLLSAGTESLSGATTGSFSTSRKKEVGTLSVSSVIPQNGSSFTFVEQYRFNKNKITYTLTEIFSNATSISGTGIGSAKIRKNIINYSVLVTVQGGTIFVKGKMKLAKNRHLTISETLAAGTGSLLATYQLNGKKKKK